MRHRKICRGTRAGTTSDSRQPAPGTREYTTLYTADVAEWILREIEGGRSLHDVCRDHGIPAYSTVQGWVTRVREGFAARFTRAREIGHTRRGRATIYTKELAERILHELSQVARCATSAWTTACRPRARCGCG